MICDRMVQYWASEVNVFSELPANDPCCEAT